MNTIPECRQQANPAGTRPAVRSRHAAIPTLATHNGGAVDAAKARKTGERSNQALAKPVSDMGVATLENLLPPSRTKSTSRWQRLSSTAMPACNGWTARSLI